MLSTQGADVSLGTTLMFYGLASAVVGPYSAWARPGWGHLASMALSLPALTWLPRLYPHSRDRAAAPRRRIFR